MNIILDTHILLWWLSDDSRLSKTARKVIPLPDNEIYISAVTVAEISIKASLGKLSNISNLLEHIEQSGFKLIDFTAYHAMMLKQLPWHHRDPFDRMLIAQSKAEDIYLLSSDETIKEYQTKHLR